jgi:hypothetical protein
MGTAVFGVITAVVLGRHRSRLTLALRSAPAGVPRHKAAEWRRAAMPLSLWGGRIMYLPWQPIFQGIPPERCLWPTGSRVPGADRGVALTRHGTLFCRDKLWSHVGEAYLAHGDPVSARDITQQGLDVGRDIHFCRRICPWRSSPPPILRRRSSPRAAACLPEGGAKGTGGARSRYLSVRTKTWKARRRRARCASGGSTVSPRSPAARWGLDCHPQVLP